MAITFWPDGISSFFLFWCVSIDNERIPYDQSYKLLFSEPEMVSSLLQDFVPDDFVESIDFSTLDRVPGSYVTDDCRERHDDIVWRVKCIEEWVYLFILIEFQSTVDPWMAVRIQSYTAYCGRI